MRINGVFSSLADIIWIHELNIWIENVEWKFGSIPSRQNYEFCVCFFLSSFLMRRMRQHTKPMIEWKGKKVILWQLLVCSFLIKMAYVPNVIGCSISSSFPNWMTRKKVHLKSTLTSAHQFAYPIPWNGLIYYLSYEYLVNSSNRPHATLPAHHISYVSFMSCGILSPWFY